MGVFGAVVCQAAKVFGPYDHIGVIIKDGKQGGKLHILEAGFNGKLDTVHQPVLTYFPVLIILGNASLEIIYMIYLFCVLVRCTILRLRRTAAEEQIP